MSIFDILSCRTEKKLVEKTVHQQDSLNYAEYELRRLKTEFSNAQNIASDVQAKIVPVLRKMMTNGVSVKDYKRLYEVRMYNLQSRQKISECSNCLILKEYMYFITLLKEHIA